MTDLKLLIVIYLIFNLELHSQNPEWIIYNTSNSGLPSNTISSIAIDANGNKWIGAGHLVKFDGQNWTVYQTGIPNSPPTSVTTITIGLSGNIWTGTFFSGLWKFDGTNWIGTNSSWMGTIHTTAIDLNGNIWTGYEPAEPYFSDFAKFDGTNWTRYYKYTLDLPVGVVYSIAIDADGSKWIGISGGLVNFKDTVWTVYDTSNSDMPYNYVRPIAIDASGNKWIGNWSGYPSYIGSLSKFDGTNWTVFDTSNSGLPHNYIRTIAIENAIIWLGGEGVISGLTKFDGTNWTVFDTSNSDLPSDIVNSIAIDASGNKWIGTNNGLAVYKEGGVSTGENIYSKNAVLYPVYPNPVYQSTAFRFYLPEKSDVCLKIFDLKGMEITMLVNQMKEKGEHSVQFNTTGLAAGIYFYRLQTYDYIKTMKMIVIK